MNALQRWSRYVRLAFWWLVDPIVELRRDEFDGPSLRYVLKQEGGIRSMVAHDEWDAKEAARGELAGSPDTLPCYECTRMAGRSTQDEDQLLEREVVALGPIAEAHRDPTQTYRLSCGHITI